MATQEFSVPSGTVFNLLEVITRLPEACHVDCEELNRVSDAIARPYLIDYFGDEDRADRYLRQRISHFACICYPYTSADRAQNITNLMIPVTLYDDTFSKPGIQESVTEATALHDRWVKVFNGECPPLEGNAAFVLVFRSIEAATAQMSDHLAARVRKAWRDMAASHLDEAVLRNNDITPDYQSYMDKRLTNVYGWWLTTHVEYAKDIDIGDLSEHPDILTARRAAINHITLVNDLYSFPKELDAKEAMNAILVLMRREEFESTRSDILKGHLGQRSDIKSYLDGIAYVMTGNLRWSQMSTRYFGDQHNGSFVTSGQITITPKPTVHAPTINA